MEWWQAVILGLVEGITEYLPVSSTGHLIIVSSLLGLGGSDETARAVDAFNIIVQGGAILAVLGLYRARVMQMIAGLLGRDVEGARLLLNLVIAFAPAAVLGVRLNDWIERVLFGSEPVAVALIAGGVYMIGAELWREGKLGRGRLHMEGGGIEDLTPLGALTIGLLQCFALWPGTSRSMMTITGGVFAGLRPAAAAEFSFLLGLPTLGGAMAFRLAKDVTGDGPTMFDSLGVVPVVLGILVATVSAGAAVQWLVGFLNRHGLAGFGWYRIVLGMVLIGLIAAGEMGS